MTTDLRWVAGTLFVLAAVAPAEYLGAAPPLRLATDGRLIVDVVLDQRLDTSVREDFARVLERLVGTGPVVVEGAPKRPAVIAGMKSLPAFKGAYDDLPAGDAFRIALRGDELHLVGSTEQAAHFAIYAFLEDLGCRWFMPGPLGEVVPKRPDLEWSGPSRLEQPDFSFRQIWWAYGGPPATAEDFRWWKLRNKVAHPAIGHGHNLTNTLPPGEFFTAHPDYYALVDGRRQPTQLCTSNADVIRLVVERIGDYYDRNPQALSYSLCPDDNKEFCECPNCTKLDAGQYEDQDLGGKPIITDRYLVFLNAVAQGIQKRHPGKMVTTYAYVNYSTPPVREQIDPHVMVVFTTSVYCCAHGIGDPQCASRQEMKHDLAGWAEACKHVYIYEYDPTPYNAELPWPMYGTHARAMPLYKSLGIRGFSFEAHNSWATLFPNFYVSARMMWDADLDYEALIDDVCRHFFGNASSAMRAYYDEMDRAIRTYAPQVEWGQEDYPRIFPAAVLARCAAHMEQARQAATDEPVKTRVEMASMGFDYLRNYLACRNAAGGQTDYEQYSAARASCVTLIDQMHAANTDFIMADVAKRYLDQGLGRLEAQTYAAEMGLGRHWMIIGPFDNHGGNGHARPYAPEQEIDLSKEYAGKEDGQIRWFKFEGQQWQGVVDLGVLIQAKDWATAYALCYVTSPEKQDVQFRMGSNDSIKAWLNDHLVWDNPAAGGRELSVDSDIVPVTLPQGQARILLKISNLAKKWCFCFRITDAQGNAIKNVRYDVRPGGYTK